MKDQVNSMVGRARVIHEKPLPEVLRFLRELQLLHAEVDDLRGALTAQLDTMKKELVPHLFAEAGVSSMAVDGYRFVISHTTRASIQNGKKDDAYVWLREHDLGQLITETVNASTLSAQARVMQEEGTELDPDLFNVYVQPNTSVTKVA